MLSDDQNHVIFTLRLTGEMPVNCRVSYNVKTTAYLNCFFWDKKAHDIRVAKMLKWYHCKSFHCPLKQPCLLKRHRKRNLVQRLTLANAC